MDIRAASSICNLYHSLFRSLLKSDHKMDETNGFKYWMEAEAVVFSVTADFSYYPKSSEEKKYDEDEERHSRTYVHLMLTGTHYVHVWAYIGQESSPFTVPLDEWTNPSNHDSCWRSDGVERTLSDAREQGVAAVQGHLPLELQKPRPQVSGHQELGGLGTPMRVARLKWKDTDNDSDYPCRYTLTSVAPSAMTIGLVEKKEENDDHFQ